MKFATFKHSNLLPLIVASLIQSWAARPITLVLVDLRGGVPPFA